MQALTAPRYTALYVSIYAVVALLGAFLALKFEALEHLPTHVLVAGTIFGGTYVAILSERIHRTIAAITGAVLMLMAGHFLGFYSQTDAVQAIDWHTIGLLVAFMVMVGMLQKTGFFEYLGIITAKKTMGDPWRLMVFLGTVVAVLSSMVNNVTCMVVLAPVIVATCEILGLNPIPMLMATVLLSGIGGVATLVGDPPNMMIGSAAGITFNGFLFHLGLPVVAAWAVTLLTLRVVMRKEIAMRPKNIEALLEMDESAAIHDRQGLRKVLVALGLVLLLFFFQGKLGLLPSSISIMGLAMALVWVRPNPDDLLKEVDWSILLFFISLFVAVGGVEKAGILDMVAEKIAAHAQSNLMFTCALLFWVAAISSAIVDNIPFTMAMIPVIQYLGTQDINTMPLWWALAMGVGFGGNGTPIGAAPNIITVSISEKTKYPITLRTWLLTGTTTMVATCIAGLAVELMFFKFFSGH